LILWVLEDKENQEIMVIGGKEKKYFARQANLMILITILLREKVLTKDLLAELMLGLI
jgi:hypothetical protein